VLTAETSFGNLAFNARIKLSVPCCHQGNLKLIWGRFHALQAEHVQASIACRQSLKLTCVENYTPLDHWRARPCRCARRQSHARGLRGSAALTRVQSRPAPKANPNGSGSGRHDKETYIYLSIGMAPGLCARSVWYPATDSHGSQCRRIG